ncbi:hypothetical protein A5780_08710 [Nocardia sp. 852002-20019_SCH5090214]|nr:hypothetical protein A5780_08710 [Nocardia sp. 852002-20019_SCH5090214]
MAAGVQLAVVVDPSRVVRVLEHLVQPFEGHRALWVLANRPCCQSKVGHGRFELFQAIASRGVQLESLAHQWCSSPIQGDRVDELALVLDSHIEVPDTSNAERAAVDGLGAHLLLDVQALQRVHQVVHHVEHALHRHGMRTFAEVLLGADEADTHLVELGFDDGGVEAVAEGTRAHVDDDVADLGMLGQVPEQLPYDRPLVDGLGRVAGLNELLDHFHTHRVCFGGPLIALGGD